jgi:DNA-directed RNA polymerase subunit RPC12/RpoP
MPEAVYRCLNCSQAIDLADTNVGTDLALCRHCGTTMPFSALVEGPAVPEPDLSVPPKGVKIETSISRGIELRHRRLRPVVLFLIPFTAVWSGFSMWGIYGRQISRGTFDLAQSLAGLPFLLGTVFLVSFIIFLLFGSHRLTISRGRAESFVGLGPFGVRKSMRLGPGTLVRIAAGSYSVNRVPQPEIIVDNNEEGPVRFGATLPSDVREFFAACLRKAARSP